MDYSNSEGFAPFSSFYLEETLKNSTKINFNIIVHNYNIIVTFIIKDFNGDIFECLIEFFKDNYGEVGKR